MSITKDKEGVSLNHPLRVNGPGSPLPHELDGDGFIEWMILQGVTEEGYQQSLKNGEQYLEDLKFTGKLPLRTDQLTPDQRGWAMREFPEHFDKPMARWRRASSKSTKVAPMKLTVTVRDRKYSEACSCERVGLKDDKSMNDGVRLSKPKYVFWGTRWDGVRLNQCEECGEVVVANTRNGKH